MGTGRPVRLKKLPRQGHWEVALLVPPGVEDPFDGGELFVADTATGTLRLHGVLGAAGGLVDWMTRAAVEPIAPHTRGRPRSLRLLPGLARDMGPIADAFGCKVSVVQRLTTIDALLHGTEPLLPGPAWAEVLPTLWAAAPWRRLPPGLALRRDGVEVVNDPSRAMPRLQVTRGEQAFTVELPPLRALGTEAGAWQEAGLVVDDDDGPRALVLTAPDGALGDDDEAWLRATVAELVAALGSQAETLAPGAVVEAASGRWQVVESG